VDSGKESPLAPPVQTAQTMKSGVKIKRVRVVGDLKVLLDRVRARRIVGQTILCDENA
jgi:hypothetical protein